MGLDAVELVMAFENAFGVAIPDADAATLTTPGHVVEYLERRVGGGRIAGCLEQRAFHRLRQAGMHVLNQPRSAFAPETKWRELFDDRHHARQWSLLGRTVGVQPWPRLSPFLSFGPSEQSVGETARRLAGDAPSAFMNEGEGWNRERIQASVSHLVKEELGLREFRWSDRFVQDLGVD